jgi:hypothetical protein
VHSLRRRDAEPHVPVRILPQDGHRFSGLLRHGWRSRDGWRLLLSLPAGQATEYAHANRQGIKLTRL